MTTRKKQVYPHTHRVVFGVHATPCLKSNELSLSHQAGVDLPVVEKQKRQQLSGTDIILYIARNGIKKWHHFIEIKPCRIVFLNDFQSTGQL